MDYMAPQMHKLVPMCPYFIKKHSMIDAQQHSDLNPGPVNGCGRQHDRVKFRDEDAKKGSLAERCA